MLTNIWKLSLCNKWALESKFCLRGLFGEWLCWCWLCFRGGSQLDLCFPVADVVLEKAMHKCILKPLKGHIEAMLKEFHTTDGSWKQLKENLQLVRQRNPQELGVFVPTPDFVDVEKIKVKFMTMQKMYSPEKKVMLLLRVCKLIYTVMENNSGMVFLVAQVH